MTLCHSNVMNCLQIELNKVVKVIYIHTWNGVCALSVAEPVIHATGEHILRMAQGICTRISPQFLQYDTGQTSTTKDYPFQLGTENFTNELYSLDF